jgi:hypothetical protein
MLCIGHDLCVKYREVLTKSEASRGPKDRMLRTIYNKRKLGLVELARETMSFDNIDYLLVTDRVLEDRVVNINMEHSHQDHDDVFTKIRWPQVSVWAVTL